MNLLAIHWLLRRTKINQTSNDYNGGFIKIWFLNVLFTFLILYYLHVKICVLNTLFHANALQIKSRMKLRIANFVVPWCENYRYLTNLTNLFKTIFLNNPRNSTKNWRAWNEAIFCCLQFTDKNYTIFFSGQLWKYAILYLLISIYITYLLQSTYLFFYFLIVIFVLP